MGGFVKGDVVVLPFPFSDLSISKKRPALVIAVAEPYSDLILCMITSKGVRDVNSVGLSPSDFVAGSLPNECNIRPNRLFTADPALILRTAGHIHPEKTSAIIDTIIRIIAA